MALNHFKQLHFRAKHFWLRDFVKELVVGLNLYVFTPVKQFWARMSPLEIIVRKKP